VSQRAPLQQSNRSRSARKMALLSRTAALHSVRCSPHCYTSLYDSSFILSFFCFTLRYIKAFPDSPNPQNNPESPLPVTNSPSLTGSDESTWGKLRAGCGHGPQNGTWQQVASFKKVMTSAQVINCVLPTEHVNRTQ